MVNSRAGSARSFAPITNTQIAAVIGAVSSQRSAQLKARIIMCRDSERDATDRPPSAVALERRLTKSSANIGTQFTPQLYTRWVKSGHGPASAPPSARQAD